MLEQRRCGNQPQKTLHGWKQQRPNQGDYCWSNSTRMGANDPGSSPMSPERDSRAFMLGSSARPTTVSSEICSDSRRSSFSWTSLVHMTDPRPCATAVAEL